MKRIKFIVLCLILFLFSCENGDRQDNSIEQIEVDSKNSVDFTKLFNEYNLIFPETKDSSFFGVLIERIERYKDRLFLLNLSQSGRNILCFSLEGKFLFSIDRIGGGPEEYTYLGDFFIDRQQDVIILSLDKNEWMYLDIDGNYLYKKKLPSEIGTIRKTYEFNDSLYIAFYECRNQNNCGDIVFLDRKSLQVKNVMYPINNDIPSLHFGMSISFNQGIFFQYAVNDTIYRLSSTTQNKQAEYFVNFGKKQQNFKNSLYKQAESVKTKQITDAVLEDILRLPNGFFSNKEYHAITYLAYDSKGMTMERGPQFQTVFYNKETKKSYNTQFINYDIFAGINNSKTILLGSCSENYFYAVINSPFSKEEIKKIVTSKHISEESKQALLNMEEDSNPIIMMFR